ncbi:putative bifunctional diguanylate cyclase/phosphodiesterase, partial [Lyngbya confervoides]
SKEQLLDHCLGIPCTAGETTEISIIQPGGGSLLAEMKVTEIPWDDEIAYLASLRDITERHHAQQQLHHQAFHDSLTNLPNRALFLDRLKHALQLQKRQPLSSIVVLFLDLDRFKLINDSFGHLVGDQLLKAFADRLQMNLRTCDTLARLGGDEFAILLEDLSDSEEALQIAQRIQDQLRSPFKIIDQELFANVSIGIALDITDYEEPEQLLRDADTAMYRAKFLGRGRYVVFDPEMRQESINRLQLENELRRALEQQELVAFYQPVVNLATGKPTGFEALIRWQHPQRGLLLPSQFVPLAEETGLIVQIDRWILAEACRQLKNQQIKHCHSEALTVNVNLSSRHLTDTTLPDYLTQILQDTGLDARNLRLELTETALIQNLEKATSLLHQIRDMHIQLCLDDFGTGYSSLSYLHRFPVSCLKIDRSFVCNMHSKLENWEIIRTIITLANTLGLDTVAEGIETYQQCSQLKSLGCSKGQGYFFYEPSALLIT